MIQSMTGYGTSVVVYKEKKIHVEVKSLNSKTLDLTTRVAVAYRDKEMEMRQMVSKALLRGKVDVVVWVEKDPTADAATINDALIAHYYKHLKQLGNNLGIPEPDNWYTTLLRLPDATAKVESDSWDEAEWEVLRSALQSALQQTMDFRIQEGSALQHKFEEKIRNITDLLAEVAQYENERVEKIKNKIVDGLQELSEVAYDRNRLEQELIYYIEKLDVSEEKQRLTNHLQYFITTLNEEPGQGKKLGFIAQEMGREINTLGSKSNHAEMQKLVVKMKDELEQIKEQVLNTL